MIKGLSSEQENLIEKYYKKYGKDEAFIKELDTREERKNTLVKRILSPSKIPQMTEIELGELIANLWASNMWGNKDYLIKKLVEENGIENIRDSLYKLLYGKESFPERFDTFMKNIKRLGPASVTEILCLFSPEKYGIWNDKARKALRVLKFDYLPLGKYRISGEEYEKINAALSLIAKKLQALGLKNAELLAVDYFLYEIWYENYKGGGIDIESEFDHDEIKDMVKQIGTQLGFETDTEVPVAHGAVVDAVWTTKISNLGVVTYVFEIHKKGSIDSLILNLQKALNNPTVQKIVAVSDKKQLDKIQKEIGGLPENFRKKLAFWEVSDVVTVYENLSEAISIISKLDLVKSQFEGQ